MRGDGSGMRGRSAKIVDVARVAGVSVATVSRALSTPEIVSAETRALVLAAVSETGYTINQAARNLRRRQTMSVVALVPNLSNPFFSQILSGIAGVLAPAGYNLLVVDTKAPGADPHLVLRLDRSRADGLIVFDGLVPAADLEPDGERPPVIMACEWIDGLDLPSIRVDNEGGARLAIDHLVGLGHRAIGHVAGPAGNILARSRAEATRAALRAHGLPVRPDWHFDGDFSLEAGRRAALAWLALEERPTAIFCASDEMACGFIGEIQTRGLVVPRDVSVVGFDDIEIVAHITPALTTVRQPRRAIGEAAARDLLRIVEQRTPAPSVAEESAPHATILPVELIARASTGAVG